MENEFLNTTVLQDGVIIQKRPKFVSIVEHTAKIIGGAVYKEFAFNTELSFNPNGSFDSTYQHDYISSLVQEEKYYYNNLGLLLKIEVTQNVSKNCIKCNYKSLLERDKWDDQEQRETTEYLDSKGNVVISKDLFGTSKYVYDSDNKILRSLYFEEDVIVNTIFYEYDEQNNLVLKAVINNKNQFTQVTTFKPLRLDSQNNWLEREEYAMNGSLIASYKRTIEYFEAERNTKIENDGQ